MYAVPVKHVIPLIELYRPKRQPSAVARYGLETGVSLKVYLK